MSELTHAANPWRARSIWAIVFAGITLSITLVLFHTYGRIETYSLPSGGVQLSVPYSRYLVGETVSFTVTNNFNSSIYVSNGCPSEPLNVYRYENNAWVRIHATTELKNCQNQERSVAVPAHHSMTATFANWPSLFSQPGKYRIAMQVQFYNQVPYQDFEIISPPPVAVATTTQPATTTSQSAAPKSTATTTAPIAATPAANTGGTSGTSGGGTTTPSPSRTPQTYTVHVTSAGNYDITSLSIYVGDTIQFVYSPPYGQEVRTHFTGINGTATSVASVTVDSEFHTRSRTFTASGTWQFKADDHNGNSGVVTVQN